MKGYLKNFQVIVALAAVGALLPLTTFAQVKTVITGTSPADLLRLNTVNVVSPSVALPTKSVTTDAAKTLLPKTGVVTPTTKTQTQTTKVSSPTTGIVAPTSPTFVAPTGGQVAPTKTAAPTGSIVPQKTTTVFPFTPTTPSRASDASATANQYAAAQVIYRAEHINRLLEVAKQRGDANAVPLVLDQLPGNPAIGIVGADGELVVDVSGAGRYNVNAAVYDIDRKALAQFGGASFVVPWTTYKNPVSLVVNIAFLPVETPTFFGGEFGGGLKVPPSTGVTPVAPITPAKPIAVTPVTSVVPEAGAPIEVYELTYPLIAEAPTAPTGGQAPFTAPSAVPPVTPPTTPPTVPPSGGAAREIPPGETPEEIFVPEEEVGVLDIFEDIGDAFSDGVEAVGDFFGDLFGIEPEAEEEEVTEEAVEAEIEFETEGISERIGDIIIESVGSAPADEDAVEEEEPGVLDFTDVDVLPEEFRDTEIEEQIGDLGFGFDSGDLALEGGFSFIETPADAEVLAGETEGENVDFFDVGDDEEEGEDLFVGSLDFGFGDLALAPEEELSFAEEEELFTPDLSAPVVPDVAIADGNVNIQFSLDGLFEFGETPLVVSLSFASGAKQLIFSNPINSDLAATFTVSTAVLSSLGSSDLDVLLTLQSAIDGFATVDTYVLGSIKL